MDKGVVAHVGFCTADGLVVIPLVYARHESQLYLRGSAMSRTIVSRANGIDVCMAVTLVDGIVLARAAFIIR